VDDEIFRDGLLLQGFVARLPEFVKSADNLQGCLALCIGNRCGDDEIIDPDAVDGKG